MKVFELISSKNTIKINAKILYINLNKSIVTHFLN